MEAEALSIEQETPRPLSFVSRHRWMISGATVVALTAAGFILLTREWAPPSDLANGIYSNDCCGTVELRDGNLIANGVELVSYTVQQDDLGPYLLTRTFVGTEDRGIVLDGGRPVLKLRLDRLPNPTRVSLPGLWGADIFVRVERGAR